MGLARAATLVLASGAIAVASAAALFGLSLFVRQRWIVFKPARPLIGDPSDVGLEFEDVRLPIGNGTRIHGWWIPAPDSRRCFVCFTGSIGNMSHELHTLAFLRSHGANVLIVDYPGFGRSEGWATETGCYRAAAAAWDFATREKGIRAGEVILFGRSLGGTVAAWLAARHPDCGRLVIHSGFSSVPDVAAQNYPYFPVRYFCYIRFNTFRQLRKCRCPVVVMHPTADTIIPLRHGERILAAAPEPKSFIPLRGDHYGNEWQSTPGLRATFAELLA